jgi:hypothetical protein
MWIWVMVAMVAMEAGIIPGIMAHGIVHTGRIPTGIVPILVGDGAAGMAAGMIHGMIPGFMEVITDIMVVTMVATMAGIMVVTMEDIMAGIMVILTDIMTGNTITEARVDVRRQQTTAEVAEVRIMLLQQEELVDAVRRLLHHHEVLLPLQTAVQRQVQPDAVLP